MEVDGDTTHKWLEDEEDRKPVLTKRPHQDIVDFKIEQACSLSPESVDCKRIKRTRRDSTLDQDLQGPSIVQPCSATMSEASPSREAQQVEPSSAPEPMSSPHNAERVSGPEEAIMLRGHVNDQYASAPMKRESSADSRWHNFQPHQGGWVDNTAVVHGFEAPSSHFASFQNGPPSPSRFNSHQGYVYPRQQERAHMVQVHEVRHVPEPQFQATPSAPMYSPAGTMPVPLSHFIPPEYTAPVPSSQPFANGMTPNQYFIPANPDLSMSDFQCRMQQPYRDQHGLAERHLASMQVHGLPFTQPASWEGRRFAGQCHNPT